MAKFTVAKIYIVATLVVKSQYPKFKLNWGTMWQFSNAILFAINDVTLYFG